MVALASTFCQSVLCFLPGACPSRLRLLPFQHRNSPASPAATAAAVAAGGQRREQGHSDLVERALLPVLPPEPEFPFALRLNADTLASAGSSSMAAVCGGALALADAGVPLKALVAGELGGMGGVGWRLEELLAGTAPSETAPLQSSDTCHRSPCNSACHRGQRGPDERGRRLERRGAASRGGGGGGGRRRGAGGRALRAADRPAGP